MKYSLSFILGVSAALLLQGASSYSAQPKYGPNAVPLSRQSNLQYFKKNPAPDFWTLIPFYLPQPTGRACGATSLALALNGALSQFPMTSDQKLLTTTRFVKEFTDKAYEETILGEKFDRTNVTNKNMARLLAGATEKLKIKNPNTLAEVEDVDLENLPQSKAKFKKALIENEKSSNDYIVISLMQGVLTSDPEGGAHVITVGGFDKRNNLVLVMDPDRDWYEPYWSPFDRVFEAMADKRADGLHPGWIHFRIK